MECIAELIADIKDICLAVVSQVQQVKQQKPKIQQETIIACVYLGELQKDRHIARSEDGTQYRVPRYYGIEKIKDLKIGDLISGYPHNKQFYLFPGTINKVMV